MTRWQDEIPATIHSMTRSHYALLEANVALKGMTERHEGYTQRVKLIDASAIMLSCGKWLYGRATGELADHAVKSSSQAELVKAQHYFAKATRYAHASLSCDRTMLPAAEAVIGGLDKSATEIWHYDDTPLVPTWAPIVLLRGSNRDMGRQYAEQCIDIFGSFIFAAVASRRIEGDAAQVIASWAEQLAAHTPSILEIAEGIAEGASARGVALSANQAISIWTGLKPPASSPEPIGVLDAEGGGRMGAYFGAFLQKPTQQTPDGQTLCAGVAVWGAATSDGAMHFAASSDHDCTFQATIVAFPDTGTPFVYTPFSANGSIPGTGRFGFAGLPGFNKAGLAYVHHGGGGACAEPPQSWGYGVPRGASTVHLLLHAKTSDAALAWELNSPIGDGGRLLGAPGGFYADSAGAYVLEDRTPDHPVFRRETPDKDGKAHQFLYATNNVQSCGIAPEMYPPELGFEWSADRGWWSGSPAALITHDKGILTRRLWALSSASRNQYLHWSLLEREGRLDFDALLSLFRTGPDVGDLSWDAAEAHMSQGGSIKSSAAHRLNAFVSIGTPSTGRYLGAIGPLTHRSTTPNRPGHGYFYFDETNTYWEFALADTLEETVSSAIDLAQQLLDQAGKLLSQCPIRHDGYERLARFLSEAVSDVAAVRQFQTHKSSPEAQMARAMRQSCRAQIRARQIIEAIEPPSEWRVAC